MRKINAHKFLQIILFLLLSLSNSANADDALTYADFTVNGVPNGQILVTMSAEDLLVPVSVLEKSGLHDFLGKRRIIDAKENVSLHSLAPDITYTFDANAFFLKIVAQTSHLGTTAYNLTRTSPQLAVNGGQGSGYLNYALTRTGEGSGATTLDGELGMSRGPGVFFTTFHEDGTNGFRRERTRYIIDETTRSIELVVGDADVNAYNGDPLGGTATIGGITLARDNALNPNTVRASGAELTGSVASSSTIEVYVNGASVLRENVAPGAFTLKDVPLTEGQNDAQIVITDAFGRTQTIEQPYYMATELLPAGKTDYAFSLGRLQNSSQTSTQYGPPIGLARYALGVRNDLTIGARLESEPNFSSLGITLAGRARLGFFSVALASSRDAGLAGSAYDLQYSYFQRGFAFSADARAETPYYANVSQNADADRALRQTRCSITKNIGKHSVAFSYLAQAFRDGAITHAEAALTDTLRLGALDVGIGRSFYRTGALIASGMLLNLNYQLGRSTQIAVTNGLLSGVPTRTLEVIRQAAPSGGLGYQFEDETQTGGQEQRQETLTYRGRYGVAEATVDQAQTSTLELSGGLAFVGREAVFTQPISGSFGIIESDIPGIRTTVNNEYVGRTDAAGRIFIPDLFPYAPNHIDLAAEDAPLNHQLVDAHSTVVPRAGSGVRIVLESHRIQAYTGIVYLGASDGRKSIPADGTLTLRNHAGASRSDLGEDGAYYFDYLTQGAYDAKIISRTGKCSFSFLVDASRGPLTRMKAQTCFLPHR